MLFLVLAYGYFMGFLDEDVDGHEGGVGEEAGVYALVGVVADDLFFDVLAVVVGLDAELLAGFVLEGGCAHEFADADVHVEQEIHFRDFGYVALDEDCSLFGVNACGEVFCEDVFDILVKCVGFGIGCEGVEVSDEEEAVVVVLHFHEFAECAVVVAEVEVACGTDA